MELSATAYGKREFFYTGGRKAFKVLFTVYSSLVLSLIAYKSLINIAICEYKSYKHGVLFYGCRAHRASRMLWSASTGAKLMVFQPYTVVRIITVLERN